jgi:uncharacterized protein (DUF433 family)
LEHPRITLAPEVLAGKPVIRGTRLSVEFVIGLMADGWTEADILENYPGITHEDILACLAYARDTLELGARYSRARPDLRFLANENFSAAAVTALAAAGHDVVLLRIAAPGAPDPNVLAWAAREQRVLLTFDKGFGELARGSALPRTCGVVLLRMPMQTPGDFDETQDPRQSNGKGVKRSHSYARVRASGTLPLICDPCPNYRPRGDKPSERRKRPAAPIDSASPAPSKEIPPAKAFAISTGISEKTSTAEIASPSSPITAVSSSPVRWR